MLDSHALWMSLVSVWAVASTAAFSIVAGWVIALRLQEQRNNRRIAFLEHDYMARTGEHPFVVQAREDVTPPRPTAPPSSP